MSNKAIPQDLATIERIFHKRGIRANEPAFYNDERFIRAESADPSFLEFYGAYVRLRPRTTEYDEHVRAVLPRVVDVVAEEIRRDGQKGVCIDGSMMLMKMLEAQGIWCYGMNGALTIESPELPSPTHFWPMDVEKVAGHVWLVAPPFEIVDVSLACQLYRRGEEKFLPTHLVAETGKRVICSAEDYCSSEVLLRARLQFGAVSADMHVRLDPSLKRRLAFFPSYEIKLGTATLRYCAGGVSASDAPDIHAITSRRWNGRLAGEMYEQVVVPAMAEG